MHIRTTRMEAFSDGVIAIIITIMVFELKFRDLAHGFSHQDVVTGLQVLWPKVAAYAFSFLVMGTMWLNHHHMYHLVQVVDEKLMWLNLHFLFWLSLIPLPTSMIGKNPMLAESAVMSMVALSFALMRGYIAGNHLMEQEDKRINRDVRKVNRRVLLKTIMGLACYLLSIPLAYVSTLLSYALFLIPTIVFFIPDGVEAASDEIPKRDELQG